MPERERDQPWLMRTYSGHSTARASNELYRTNLAKGQTGLSIAFDLPTQTGYDPDSPMAKGEVGKVGVPVAHLGHMRTLLDGIPPGQMNTSMTINATAAWLLGLYVANAEEHGVAIGRPARHDAERHREGVPVAGHLHLPARAEPPVDRRHGRLVRGPRAQVEPDERLQLPPAGGGRDAGAGDRVRAGDRDRRARRGARVRPGRGRSISGRRRLDLVLRQRRHPLRRRDVQAAGLHRAVGPHRPRALRRHRSGAAPIPLRRAGQLARPHRGAAGEQRAAHHPRDARGHAVEAGARPIDPAAGVERSARAAAPVGSAVVVADATSARVRDRPARVRRHLRRLPR